jgi:hypothetical protein
MRPRRWYTDEVAPPGRRDLKLTARLWRYRSLVRRKKNDAAPYYRAASLRWRRFIDRPERGPNSTAKDAKDAKK